MWLNPQLFSPDTAASVHTVQGTVSVGPRGAVGGLPGPLGFGAGGLFGVGAAQGANNFQDAGSPHEMPTQNWDQWGTDRPTPAN